MAANNKQFLLGLVTEKRLRTLCDEWGVKITDGRLGAPGIAKLLARKRSLDLTAVIAALSDVECAAAATELGLPQPASPRDALADALGKDSWAAVRRAHRVYDLPLETLDAELLDVIDGDTLRVSLGGQVTFVRLRGIDAPESGPSDKAEADLDRAHLEVSVLYALGKRSADWLRQRLPAGSRVQLRCQPTPQGPKPYLHHRGHRLLAFVMTTEPARADIGREMIERGLALVWPRGLQTRRYAHPLTSEYVTACNRALESQPGLWREGMSRMCPRFESGKMPWTQADCMASCGPGASSESFAE